MDDRRSKWQDAFGYILCAVVVALVLLVCCLALGCVSSSITRRVEDKKPDGSSHATETRVSAFALSKAGLDETLNTVQSVGGGIWGMIPEPIKATGLGLLGLGGLGYHSSTLRKHKEKSYNAGLHAFRQEPPHATAERTTHA